MRRRWELAALLAGAVMMTACGGRSAAGASKPAAGPAQDVTIKGQDTMRFDPATLTVKAGSPVHLTMDDPACGDRARLHDRQPGWPEGAGQPQPNGTGQRRFHATDRGHFPVLLLRAGPQGGRAWSAR